MYTKLFASALAIALLFFFSGAVHASYFPRPWENQTWVAANPYIWDYGLEYWFGVSQLQKTIDGIGLDGLDYSGQLSINGTAAQSLARAQQAAKTASYDSRSCSEALVADDILISFPLSSPVGFLDAFSRVESCLSYRSDWIGALEPSLETLETGLEESRSSMQRARHSYEGLEQAGLCDQDYTQEGSGHCAKMKSLFDSIDNNITDGAYGAYPLLLNYTSQMRSALHSPVPDLSLYQSSIKLVWGSGGILESFDNVSSDAVDAKASAERRYQAEANLSKKLKAALKDKLGNLDSEDIFLIDRAPASSQVHAGGAVDARLNDLKKQESALADAIDESSAVHDARGQGYLSSSTNALLTTNQKYEGSFSQGDALLDDALSCESQEKQDALDELGRSEDFMKSGKGGPDGAAILVEANTVFASASSGSTIGKRYLAYSKSAELARKARSSQTLQQVMDASRDLSSLRDLIARAETDGINVETEKGDLKLLETMSGSDISSYIDSDTATIIAKARAKYDADIGATKKRLRGELSLAGPGASDLFTDLDRCESGIFDPSGSIIYPGSIGKLKKLQSDYSLLANTLDSYMRDIVGNSMSATEYPIIGTVELDRPANVLVDAVLSNSHEFSAKNITARISLGSWSASPGMKLDFAYSDIIRGKGNITTIRMEDGGNTIALGLPDVQPFEALRVTLEKNLTIAHTSKHISNAEGIGNGAASVGSGTVFRLDCDIPYLSTDYDADSATIDGGPLDAPLQAGIHNLSLQTVIQDAYAQSMTNIEAFPIGLKSQVEYDIEILPVMDLDSALVMVDILNESNISLFQAISATGEMLKDKQRVSPTQYSMRIMNLRKGIKSTIRISYQIDDTGSYVQEQISQMEGMNLSIDALSLLDSARIQAGAGNYTAALAYIEKARALSAGQTVQDAKLQAKFDVYSKKVNIELALIDSIIMAAKEENLSGDPLGNDSYPLLARLEARKSELGKILSRIQSGTMNMSEEVDLLSGVDYSWLPKEIAAFRKDSYSRYNSLKERYLSSGNSTLPGSFSDFESALNQLDASNDPVYAPALAGSLAAADSDVIAQESMLASQKADSSAVLDRVKADLDAIMSRYFDEATSAKGTVYESMFDQAKTDITKKLSDAEAALSKDPRILQLRLDDLDRSRKSMLLTLDSLRNQSENRFGIVTALVNQSDLDENTRKNITDRMSAVRSMIDSGHFINSLRALDTISKQLDSATKKSDSSTLLLGLSAAAVLATLAVYLFTQRKDDVFERLSEIRVPFLQAERRKKSLRRLGKTKEPEGFQAASEPEEPARP